LYKIENLEMKITNMLHWSRICRSPTMAVIAQKCPNQVTVDLNEERIAAWNDEDDNIPIYEPGLSRNCC
jgi:hypothetical protein